MTDEIQPYGTRGSTSASRLQPTAIQARTADHAGVRHPDAEGLCQWRSEHLQSSYQLNPLPLSLLTEVSKYHERLSYIFPCEIASRGELRLRGVYYVRRHALLMGMVHLFRKFE